MDPSPETNNNLNNASNNLNNESNNLNNNLDNNLNNESNNLNNNLDNNLNNASNNDSDDESEPVMYLYLTEDEPPLTIPYNKYVDTQNVELTLMGDGNYGIHPYLLAKPNNITEAFYNSTVKDVLKNILFFTRDPTKRNKFVR